MTIGKLPLPVLELSCCPSLHHSLTMWIWTWKQPLLVLWLAYPVFQYIVSRQFLTRFSSQTAVHISAMRMQSVKSEIRLIQNNWTNDDGYSACALKKNICFHRLLWLLYQYWWWDLKKVCKRNIQSCFPVTIEIYNTMSNDGNVKRNNPNK